MSAPSDHEMKVNPSLRTPRYWAELAIDNSECGAQVLIEDKILRESLVLNVETIIGRAIKYAKAAA